MTGSHIRCQEGNCNEVYVDKSHAARRVTPNGREFPCPFGVQRWLISLLKDVRAVRDWEMVPPMESAWAVSAGAQEEFPSAARSSVGDSVLAVELLAAAGGRLTWELNSPESIVMRNGKTTISLLPERCEHLRWYAAPYPPLRESRRGWP